MTTGANQILPFADDVSANVLSQSAYNTDSQRHIGNQPGIARSNLVNKTLRQVSIMAAGLAQFIANRQANDITDSLTETQIETYLQAAIANHSASPGNISTTPQSWWRKSSDGYIEQGISGIVVPSLGGTIVVPFPLAFSSVILDIQVSVNNSATQQIGWSSPSLSQVTLETGNGDTLARTANIIVRGY